MSGEYGYHSLNGISIRVVPGQILIGGTGADEFSIDTTSLLSNGHASVRVEGRGGRDVFTGDAARVYGGPGDDLFMNGGIWRHPTGETRTFSDLDRGLAFGGKGNDTFADFYGSSDVYGGSGDDVWGTVLPGIGAVNHSLDGDVDRVWLGFGNDTAVVRFGVLSTHEGIVLEPRTIILDGGRGVDRLVLQSPWLPPSMTVLDLRDVQDKVTTIAHTTFTNFGTFSLLLDDPDLREVRLGRGNDVVEFSIVAERTASLKIVTGGGHDRVVGALAEPDEFIYGGAGNDTLSGGGGMGMSGWYEEIYGGTGDDVLSDHAIATGGEGECRMFGGSGRDWFVLGSQNAAVVEDFTQGRDRLVLDRASGYLLGPQVRTEGRALRGDAVSEVQDGAAELSFLLHYLAYGRAPTTEHWRYDKSTGEVQIEDLSYSDLYHTIATITDAPDLGMSDFLYIS